MRTINAQVDILKRKHNKNALLCIGAGRGAEVLRKDFDDHLQTGRTECGFRYLRFHGIFHDEMDVYREDRQGRPIHNWQYIDAAYDLILEKGLKPFVEIGFMPKALASGEQTIFWWKGNVTPPKDYAKWSAFVTAFVEHLENRYGRDEIQSWFFEVWNEPNLNAFFKGADMAEYFKLYDHTAKAIKAVCQDYKVGGPATSANA
jgi:xylan 1,4-beta-xylosidase